MISFTVDGQPVEVHDDGDSLLGVLRDQLGQRSAKDGCSPQGQCGCCTVLVDGQPRVSCVTPARRVAGRTITTIDGLDPLVAERWADAFCAAGASQCGFCTPGIILRFVGLHDRKPDAASTDIDKALAAHLCRCTGWQTITDAWHIATDESTTIDTTHRDITAAERRARLEGRVDQTVGPAVALGHAGFADDAAPGEALVAVRGASGDWVLGESLHEARTAVGKVQGRRSTLEPSWPVELPDGVWDATLQTTWVEPSYLETDASWALPGKSGADPLGNGGAFGAKTSSPVALAAAELAAREGRPVRALFSREDTVRFGPKRPPLAGGANADGTGHVRVVDTPGIAEAIGAFAPQLKVELVPNPTGLTTSLDLRAAGWAEVAALLTLARGSNQRIVAPDGGWAEASVNDDGIEIAVGAGEPLDEIVLRSYCIGAAHMAWSWVTSEALAIDADGEVQDLTIRSFGVARSADTPRIAVVVDPAGPPVHASDAVFAAVAGATALHLGANRWPAHG